MEKQTQILDASVVVKWFSKEENSDEALNLKESYLNGEIILITTILTKLEVLNALKYKGNSEENLKKANEYLENLQIRLVDINNNLLDKAIEISIKYKITIYDSIYAAIAQIYGCQLITADKELFKVPNVISLNES